MADRLVGLIAADLDRLAFAHGLAADEAHVEDSLLVAALAGDLDLFDRVREFEWASAAFEEVSLKVRAQAEAEDGQTRHQRERPQLIGDLGRQELRLIDEHTVDAFEGLGVEGRVAIGREIRIRPQACA